VGGNARLKTHLQGGAVGTKRTAFEKCLWGRYPCTTEGQKSKKSGGDTRAGGKKSRKRVGGGGGREGGSHAWENNLDPTGDQKRVLLQRCPTKNEREIKWRVLVEGTVPHLRSH